MPTALSAAWIATVPVLTHWAYLTVCSSANFFAKATECWPGNGWPPHFVLVNTSSSACASSFVEAGQLGKGVFLSASPPVIASFPTAKISLAGVRSRFEQPAVNLEQTPRIGREAAKPPGRANEDWAGPSLKIELQGKLANAGRLGIGHLAEAT